MPSFEEVLEQHKDSLENAEVIGESYRTVAEKLQSLGYDVLINHRDKAEFVPISRLNETAAQRDQFKQQATELNAQLEQMKEKAKDNKELQEQIQEQIDQNNKLLEQVEKTKVEAEILLAARDANNPRDVLAFVDMSKIKVNSKGEVTGIDAEIERIKQEKPYLFKDGGKKRGGSDRGGGNDKESLNMNALIRRAAGIR